MKTDVNGCSTCQSGEEHYETFHTRRGRGPLYQYDYRTPDGALFSTVAFSLSICRDRRDQWLKEREAVRA